MKVVKEKAIEVEYVVPETKAEDMEIKKIIREIKTDKEMKNPKAWIKQKAGKNI